MDDDEVQDWRMWCRIWKGRPWAVLVLLLLAGVFRVGRCPLAGNCPMSSIRSLFASFTRTLLPPLRYGLWAPGTLHCIQH
jgi:hypothetical protein